MPVSVECIVEIDTSLSFWSWASLAHPYTSAPCVCNVHVRHVCRSRLGYIQEKKSRDCCGNSIWSPKSKLFCDESIGWHIFPGLSHTTCSTPAGNWYPPCFRTCHIYNGFRLLSIHWKSYSTYLVELVGRMRQADFLGANIGVVISTTSKIPNDNTFRQRGKWDVCIDFFSRGSEGERSRAIITYKSRDTGVGVSMPSDVCS